MRKKGNVSATMNGKLPNAKDKLRSKKTNNSSNSIAKKIEHHKRKFR